MNVYEMEGFLRGKCLPGDLKVNESNAEYLVRKVNAVSELKGELTAALATIEKCREISGCPAGVDLQDHLRQLASELSVVEEIHNNAVFITDELYDASPKEVQNIIRSLACMKMPAYARLVAGIKADGVELFAAEQRGVAERLQKRNVAAASRSISFCLDSAEEAEVFANQLRKGGK
ncbi:hypothetical protein AAHT98_15615 [Klebsiella pneumoniae]|jgi:hypothetical protein|nr:hypothetical protein [Klebsiella pneumoniae]HDU8885993.1 hypothetical protein [Klebsiella pneumoniae]